MSYATNTQSAGMNLVIEYSPGDPRSLLDIKLRSSYNSRSQGHVQFYLLSTCWLYSTYSCILTRLTGTYKFELFDIIFVRLYTMSIYYYAPWFMILCTILYKFFKDCIAISQNLEFYCTYLWCGSRPLRYSYIYTSLWKISILYTINTLRSCRIEPQRTTGGASIRIQQWLLGHQLLCRRHMYWLCEAK